LQKDDECTRLRREKYREKEAETETETDRETDREIERQTETDRNVLLYYSISFNAMHFHNY